MVKIFSIFFPHISVHFQTRTLFSPFFVSFIFIFFFYFIYKLFCYLLLLLRVTRVKCKFISSTTITVDVSIEIFPVFYFVFLFIVLFGANNKTPQNNMNKYVVQTRAGKEMCHPQKKCTENCNELIQNKHGGRTLACSFCVWPVPIFSHL